MSGGVDSAVALLKAGPDAIGVTLRLWLDPDGPDAERACCSPEAVIAARRACHERGLPHVTLDLREEFRRAVVDPFVARLRARRDAEPLHPLQRRLPLRAPARLRAPRRRRHARDRPLRAHRRAPRPAPARPRRRPRQGPATCSRRSTPRSSPGSGSRSAVRRRRETRAEAQAAGLEVAREGREPGGLLPRRRRLPRLSSSATGSSRRGADRGRGRQRARPPRRLLALHPGPAPRPRRRGRRARLRPSRRAAHEHRRRRAARGARARTASTPAAGSSSRRPGRGEAPLPRARGAGRRRADRGRLPPPLRQPVYAVAPGQVAVLYEGDAVVGVRTIVGRGVRSTAVLVAAFTWTTSGSSRSPSSCSPRVSPRVRPSDAGRISPADFSVDSRERRRSSFP